MVESDREAQQHRDAEARHRSLLSRARGESLRLLAILAGFLVLLSALTMLVEAPPEGPTVGVTMPSLAPLPDAGELPDFGAITNVQIKKRTFFEFLLPVIAVRNERMRDNRRMLGEMRARLAGGEPLSARGEAELRRLAELYRMDPGAVVNPATIDQLLRRVDVLPPSLVLAQAATESAWGTSRFARSANNLFGQWCFTPGCGLVPQRRAEGADHEVKQFDSVGESVDSYFLNLNSHPAYKGVRDLRQQARAAGEPPEGVELAQGLELYSARGEDYIEELQAIIRFNDLDEYDLAR